MTEYGNTNLLHWPVRTSGLHIRVKAGLTLCGRLLWFLEEFKQVGVDRVGLGRGHTVRKVLVGFQCAIPQQLCRQVSSGDIRHDLIVLAMHDQDWHSDLL